MAREFAGLLVGGREGGGDKAENRSELEPPVQRGRHTKPSLEVLLVGRPGETTADGLWAFAKLSLHEATCNIGAHGCVGLGPLKHGAPGPSSMSTSRTCGPGEGRDHTLSPRARHPIDTARAACARSQSSASSTFACSRRICSVATGAASRRASLRLFQRSTLSASVSLC